MTPHQMVAGVLEATRDWEYDAVAIGYPGPILCGEPMAKPVNLGPGWVGFDFEAVFQRPVKIINDAAMQALGSYQGRQDAVRGVGNGFRRRGRQGRDRRGAGSSAGFTIRRARSNGGSAQGPE